VTVWKLMIGAQGIRMRWRPEAGRLVTLMAVAFGLTVVITRLYLMTSGYPKIGGGTYHIAHALFGGLLLVISVLLLLMSSGRRAMIWAALLSGVGLGLFIDEVGKFITSKNNYFTPVAAPIIYVVFLGVLALARRASRPRQYDARGQTYVVLDDLTRVADARVGTGLRADLLSRLTLITTSTDRPDLADLAGRLRPYVASPAVQVQSIVLRRQRVVAWLEKVERRLLPRVLHRIILIVLSLLIGLYSLVGLAVVVVLATSDANAIIKIDDQTIRGSTDAPVLIAAGAGETIVGLLLLTSTVLLIFARDRRGIQAGIVGLVLSLAGVNILLGYVSAETVVAAIIVELPMLGLYVRYRKRFLAPSQC
jgi:hypothetical protein